MSKQPQVLTPGRIVRYMIEEGVERPGIVVSVEETIVELSVFVRADDPVGIADMAGVTSIRCISSTTEDASENPAKGTWHWPPR